MCLILRTISYIINLYCIFYNLTHRGKIVFSTKESNYLCNYNKLLLSFIINILLNKNKRNSPKKYLK